MSLRRTALTRRTELRRTPIERRVREKASRTRRTIARRRQDTGPTAAQRRVVAERAGYCCEVCGTRLAGVGGWTQPHSFHHRQPRGMGGTSRLDVHAAYCLLLLCGTGTTGCHGLIESSRAAAYPVGWLVRQGQNPAEVPVWVRGAGLVLLTVDGQYAEVDP